MKKIKLISISILSVLIFLTSCGNDDDSTNQEQNYYFTVKIDGVEHSFNKDLANLKIIGVNAIQVANAMSISHLDDNGNSKSISFNINDINISTPTDDFLAAFHLDGQGGVWDPDHSTTRDSKVMTISENNDTYIKGTFSFTGHNAVDDTTKEFTEGRFKAKKR